MARYGARKDYLSDSKVQIVWLSEHKRMRCRTMCVLYTLSNGSDWMETEIVFSYLNLESKPTTQIQGGTIIVVNT